MTLPRGIIDELRGSDGRIGIGSLTGVAAVAAAIALLVGVLPALAATPDVTPEQVDWGGGSGACNDVLASLEDPTTERGPSAARYEFHIQNPRSGTYPGDPTDPFETEITIEVAENDESFTFTIGDGSGPMVAYDVVVNGGKKSNHYDYDAENDVTPSGDSGLTAPEKDNREGELHKLSHINLCYDLEPTFFQCGVETPAVFLNQVSDELFTVANATIFANSVDGTCEPKAGFFFIDNVDPNVLLDFGDESDTVAGRLDITKNFGDTTFQDLTYIHDGLTDYVDLSWCSVRDAVEETGEMEQFSDVLSSEKYPSLDGVLDTDLVDAIACKVFEGENADGIQYNVIYFEFVDPRFK